MSERLVEWARRVPAVGPEPDRALLVCLAGAADDAGHGRATWAQLEAAVWPRGCLARGFLGRLVRRRLVTVHGDGDGVEFDLSTTRYARVAYDRALVLEVPVTDSLSGLRLEGLGVTVRLERELEVSGDGEPDGAVELNDWLRVSFDRERGVRLWPGGCGAEVVGWWVLEPSGLRAVSRFEFEGLVERYRDLIVENENLATVGWHLCDALARSHRAPVAAGASGRGLWP